MSLEQKIEALTEQVTQLTDAVTVLKNVFMQQLEKAPVADLAVAVMDLPPAKAEAPNAEQEPTKSSTTTDTSKPSSDELPQVTYDDVKNVTIAVSKIDKAKAVAGLARFGVTTAKALNESQWPEYVVYMKKVAAGDLDRSGGFA